MGKGHRAGASVYFGLMSSFTVYVSYVLFLCEKNSTILNILPYLSCHDYYLLNEC